MRFRAAFDFTGAGVVVIGDGSLDPALGLTAQRIVDTAAQSAREKRTLELLP
jgi:hypothetical protein